jgi:glycine/D-amino acid oxidase-like deaminating enzyme
MIGGEDEPFLNPRLRDRLLPRNNAKLERRLRRLLPGAETETAFAWTGTFGETADGLPYIGALPEAPRRLFALGYGGNGLTFAVIAADLIRQLISGERPGHARLFRLDR